MGFLFLIQRTTHKALIENSIKSNGLVKADDKHLLV